MCKYGVLMYFAYNIEREGGVRACVRADKYANAKDKQATSLVRSG